MTPHPGLDDTGPLVDVIDLSVGFRVGRGPLAEAVKGVSFRIGRRSTLAIVGESGSGKTVSAMSILGLLPANAVVGAQLSRSKCAASAARTSR